jgi:hypothetical protein
MFAQSTLVVSLSNHERSSFDIAQDERMMDDHYMQRFLTAGIYTNQGANMRFYGMLFLMSVSIVQAATISVKDSVRGVTPVYMGFNPGSGGGYRDGSHYGDPNAYGTHAFWLKQTGANMMRNWNVSRSLEGSIDPYASSWENDNTPDGNGVTDTSSFLAARQQVIANPANNPYIVWDRFNAARHILLKEDRLRGLEPLCVMRHKHGGSDNFPPYMGGYTIPADQRDPGLSQ